MKILHTWVLGLTGASILAALAQQLTPEGPVKRVTRFVCGVMLSAVMLSPLVKADREVFSGALAGYRKTAAELTGDLESQEKQLLRIYIQEQSSAYIWDEAQRLGITDLTCSVKVKWREESWIPWEATLTTAAPEALRQPLRELLDAELGIPAERQYWNEP